MTQNENFDNWTQGDLERARAELAEITADLSARARARKGGPMAFRLLAEKAKLSLVLELCQGDPSTPEGLRSHFKAQGALEMLARFDKLFDFDSELERMIEARKGGSGHA